MSAAPDPRKTEPVVLHLQEVARRMDGPAFFAFCQANRDWRIELTHTGDAIVNGARLGWPMGPIEKRVFVYRPGALPDLLQNPATVSGNPPGFVLDVRQTWAP